jgi:catechol 2,3-dioxygenase-like lactoylglutathione lyase family enzyme
VFTGINHVCIATRDLDRAVRAWADRYGVGPWSVYTKDASNMTATVHGTPADFAMRVALASLPSGARIELIEPLDDRSPYAQSLAANGGADHIHHVRFDVADYADAASHLRALGPEELLDARFDGAGGSFTGTYFATQQELGLVVEIGGAPPGFEMPPPERVYPESRSPTASNAVSRTASPP